MKKDNTKPYIFKFQIFGYNIYISRDKLRRKDKLRSRTRLNAKKLRMAKSDYHCELCGIRIDSRCVLFHLLPKGAPARNLVRNVRVICPECHHRAQALGAYRPMITMSEKGGAK